MTDHGPLLNRLTEPKYRHTKRYWAQVEGGPVAAEDVQWLQAGVLVKGKLTAPCRVAAVDNRPDVAAWTARIPPVVELHLPPGAGTLASTGWLELDLTEGRKRQVRRMCAAVGHPVLRLVRVGLDLCDGGPPLTLKGLERPGQWRAASADEHARLSRLVDGPSKHPAESSSTARQRHPNK
jgi:23S rRNA pseudouridine2457 synthase